MSLLERDSVLVSTTENGDPVVDLPFTRVNNVEGIGRCANTIYSVGNVVYTDSNLSVALKCTTAGTTSNTELDVSGNNVGDTVTDGTVVWQVCNRTSDVTSVNGKTGDVVIDLPVGHMYWSVEPNVPAGRLPAMGATYNRALYADLWAWANSVGLVKTESEWQAIASANDGNCAYYSSGDGSTTFRVPSIKTWTKGASSVEEVGSYLEAGLPNVEGVIGTTNDYLNQSTGAFYAGNSALRGTFHVEQTNAIVAFDASRSNSIYGNSDTVQPPSLVGMWLIVAFGIAHNIGEADVANVMQAVERVQTGLGTLEQGVGTAIDYIVESYRNGTEWYEVYKSGKVRQGGYKGASKNGGYTCTFNKPMSNTNYTALAFGRANGNWLAAAELQTTSRSTTSIHIVASAYNDNEGNYTGFDWVVEGQGA